MRALFSNLLQGGLRVVVTRISLPGRSAWTDETWLFEHFEGAPPRWPLDNGRQAPVEKSGNDDTP